MKKLKGIKLYFFSIIKLFSINLKNYYFSSNFYNKKLVTFIPDRIFYKPSTYLASSLTSVTQDFYKITNTNVELLWKKNLSKKFNFNNLHSFLWLTKLSRKNSQKITQKIIKSWIDKFFNYDAQTWGMEIVAKRIIAWASNIEITLENSDQIYKENFLICLLKQSNFLQKNINSVSYDHTKIICCSAIILSGLIFKENNSSFKVGVKELEKTIKNYFDKNGFPKSRNPEEVFICTKYLILIREWFKEAQIDIPNFLNEIIIKIGSCYGILSSSNKQFPLFNGATEINHKEYDLFLKTLKYKFVNKGYEISDFYKIKNRKLEFFIDCGDPPPDNFSRSYQAGCLSFELISNKQKIISNSGYGKFFPNKITFSSRATAAHSTLYINDTSSCTFQKNDAVSRIYGNSLLKRHKIISKNYLDEKDFFLIYASHNGFEKEFGYLHNRSVKIFKKSDRIIGTDELKKRKSVNKSLVYFVRFHIHYNAKIVKTKAGDSILISLPNGEGWLLKSDTNIFKIEKNIFLGNKKKIINSESVYISGIINKEIVTVKWLIERAR